MKTIKFDKNATHWNRNEEINSYYLSAIKDYILDLFKIRGYIYLNQIYEHFGIRWNPKIENDLYLTENGLIKIEFEPIGDGDFLIHIS